MAVPRLSLHLLGTTRVEQDGRLLEVDTRKAIALLAYLVTTGKGQPRDALVALLWPESDRYHASAGLRRTLSVLRGALSGDWLRIDRITIALPPNPGVWSDVDEFRKLLAERSSHSHPLSAVCPACLPLLAQAADLHRGDFMSSFGLRDSPDFDDWQMQQAEAWRGELSHTLEMLVQGYITQGDLESGISRARRWLALDRLNEAAHGQLMRLYTWTGRRPAALQQYQECAKILQEQLGASPQDSLIALHDAIRGGGLRQPPLPVEGKVDAEATFGPQPTPALSPSPAATPQTATVLEEKRTVTVLYADASQGFAARPALAADAEASLVHRFVKASEAILGRYGGHVARIVGDSVLAVFGAARTRESDPELAIRAALEMQDEAGKLGLSLSTGISTGQVYASRTDAPAGQHPGLVGRAIDLALRLAGQGQAGQILVLESTHRATRRAFAFTPVELPGGAGTRVTVYRVEHLLAQPAKARGIEDLQGKLTGRDEELARLKAALQHAAQGEGQMVSLIGEAGAGKSRLVAELKEHALAGGKPVIWLEGRCLEMGIPAGYAPFLDILRGYFAWTAEDDRTRGAAISSSLSKLVEQGRLATGRVAEIEALLCRLLSVPAGDAWDEQLAKEGPEQVRHRTFLALRDFVLTIARSQPLVLIFEDLHWADSLSIDLIGLLTRSLCGGPLLLVCSYRPDRESAARNLASIALQNCPDAYSELYLHDLTPQQSRQLVQSLLAQPLHPALQDAVLNRAQGNPFFIEEIIRSLIERGSLYRQGDEWRARTDIESIDVPDSVQSVILSRVDRLSEDARHTLQTAAVIGRLFSKRVLGAATEQNANLDAILDELAERAVVYQERMYPEVEYSFKHVLTQQAVYGNILAGRRAEMHRRVATAVEMVYPEDLATHYEELAYHYEQAGRVDKALDYLLIAGDKAQRQYANQEAIDHYRRALAIYEADPLLDRAELALQVYERLGDVQAIAGQLDQARDTYIQALSRTSSEDRLRQARLHRKLGANAPVGDAAAALPYFTAAESLLGPTPATMPPDWQQEWLEIQVGRMAAPGWGGIREATELARKLLPVVEALGDARRRAVFLSVLAKTTTYRDRWVVSSETLALVQAEVAASRESADSMLIATSTYELAEGHALRGELDAAEQGLQESLNLAEKIGYVGGQSMALSGLIWIYRRRGQIDLVRRYLPRALESAKRTDRPANLGSAEANLAWLAWREGRLADIEAHGQAALDLWQRNSPAGGQWLALFPLLAAAYAQGQMREAIDFARRLLDPTLQRLPEALEERLMQAIAAWNAGEVEGAREHLSQAVELAQQEGGYL